MRKKFFLIVIPGLVIGVILALIVMAVSKPERPEAELLQTLKSDKGTFSDRNIQKAQGFIESQPKKPKGYNMLAAAFMQKARETGDFSLNALAEKSLEHSFRVAPDNYEAIKLYAAVLLNYHRFAEALEQAKRAQAMRPNDHEVYGAIVDAQVELGNYDEAVDAAQKMVDLRPYAASYARISYLRSLHGDTPGAIEMMKMAVESGNPQSPESIAWTRVHLGDELVKTGKTEEAEREYDHALYLFPGYHLALAAKARARYAAGDTAAAEKFYKQAIERVPLPDYISALGDLYTKLGRTDEAKQQYEQVEVIEKLGTYGGTYSRELALFWANHDINSDEALAAAERERANRKDIYTSDVLAWSLYKKGRFEEAQKYMDEAMRLNTDDPRLLYHAGMIASANGDSAKAADYLKQALEINPNFDILQAEVAKEKLNALKGE